MGLRAGIEGLRETKRARDKYAHRTFRHRMRVSSGRIQHEGDERTRICKIFAKLSTHKNEDKHSSCMSASKPGRALSSPAMEAIARTHPWL